MCSSKNKLLKDGFLDKDVIVMENMVSKKYKDIFEFIGDINRKAYSIINISESILEDYQAVIYLLYKNIHTSFQSSIILLKKGLSVDSDIIFRTMYECLFKMKSIINNKDNYKLLELSSNYESQKFIETVYNDETLQKYRNDQTKIELEKLDSQHISIYKFAKLAGMVDTYKREYALLCSPVHSDLRTLDNKIQFQKDGIIINSDFDYSDLVNMLFSRITFALEVLETINLYFNNDENNINMKDLLNSYDKLLQKYFKQSKS